MRHGHTAVNCQGQGIQLATNCRLVSLPSIGVQQAAAMRCLLT